MQTKQISQQATAGAEALAGRAANIEGRQAYERFKARVEAFLEDWEDFETDLRELSKVSELAGMLTDLGLDSGDIGNRVNYISDNYKQIKRGIDNILSILYDLKGV